MRSEGGKQTARLSLANWQQNSQEVTKDNQTHARTGHVPDVPGCYFDYPWALVDIAVRLPRRHGPAPCALDERVCEKKVTQLLVQIDILARTRSGSPRGPNAGSQASASRPLRGEGGGGHEGPRRADGLGASVSEGIESASAPDEVRFKVPKLLSLCSRKFVDRPISLILDAVLAICRPKTKIKSAEPRALPRSKRLSGTRPKALGRHADAVRLPLIFRTSPTRADVDAGIYLPRVVSRRGARQPRRRLVYRYLPTYVTSAPCHSSTDFLSQLNHHDKEAMLSSAKSPTGMVTGLLMALYCTYPGHHQTRLPLSRAIYGY